MLTRIHKPSILNPPFQRKVPLFSARFAPAQTRQDSHGPSPQEELENAVPDQDKVKASGLQHPKDNGTIALVIHENPNILQAQMDNSKAQRPNKLSQPGHSFANVSIHARGQQASTPIQSKFAIPRNREVDKQSSLQQSPETARDEATEWIQRKEKDEDQRRSAGVTETKSVDDQIIIQTKKKHSRPLKAKKATASKPTPKRNAAKSQGIANANSKPTPERNAAKNEALTNIRQFERQISVHVRDWSMAARAVGSGYETAGTRHTTATKAAASQKAIHQAILFGILTAASAGAFSWVSTVVQNANKSREVLLNVLEDVVQSGVGEGIDVGQAKVAPSAKSVSGGYLSYQNDLLNHLDELTNNVTLYFIQVVKEIQVTPWSSWDNFSSTQQKKRHSAWLGRSILSRSPTVPSQDKIADSLEIDVWARWLPGLIVQKTRVGCFGNVVKYEDITDPGEPVENRLNKLGITSQASIGKDFGWWTSDAEVRRLKKWALGHTPKKIIDL